MTIEAKQIAELLQQHAGALELYASQFTRLAADAVQDAFVALAEQSTMPENPRAWLYRVVRFKALDAGRADSRRQRLETEVAKSAGSRGSKPITPYKLVVDETVAALQGLPIEQREVIVAPNESGAARLSFREIASLTEIPSSTCHRVYQAGIDALKRKIGVTMSDELTEFERRLAQLQPRSFVDRDQILFSAGQASVSCTPRPVERVWKILATCSTVAALLLMVALGLTRQSLSDSRHRVLVLQNTLQQGSAPRAGQQATTEGRWPRLAETSLPDDELVANLPASSPFMWRRTNLNMEIPISPLTHCFRAFAINATFDGRNTSHRGNG